MVETSGICNLRCIMCPTNGYDLNKNIMDDIIFNKVLDLINDLNIRQVLLYGYGEPLLDPKLSRRIQLVREKKTGVSIYIVSNGTLFDNERTTRILDAGVDQINISFDAGSKEIYEKIRVNSNFEKTVENIKILASMRSKDKTALHVTYVVLKENLHDMESAIKLFYGLGFDSITFSPHLIPFNKYALSQTHVENIARTKLFRLKKEWGNRFTINEYGFSINHGINDCTNRVTSGSLFINCIGDVSPCCMLAHHVPIHKKTFFGGEWKDSFFPIGNIATQNIKEILNNEKYGNFINTFQSSHLPDQCKGCRVVNTKLLRKIDN